MAGTSLQHKTKSSIHHMVWVRRPDTRAWKVARFTPGGPSCVRKRTELSARMVDRMAGVSRGHSSRRRNEPLENCGGLTPAKARTVPGSKGPGK